MQKIKGNPQVYTTQEGTKNWIHTNSYQETALCLDSFFWLKVQASTINLYNSYPLLVPEFLCQARLFLTDIIAISMIFRLEAFPAQSVRSGAIWFTASTTRLCFETSRIHLLDFSLSNYSGTETTWRYNMYIVWLPGVERIFSSLRPGSGE